MQSFHEFVELNMTPLVFAYGLAYFCAGLAIILQQRRLSNFRLAHYLWMVGMFGLIHGVADWGNVFIPLQSSYLSDYWIRVLREVQEFGWAISFAFLLQFGVSIIAPKLPWIHRVRTFVRWYIPFWSASVIFVGLFLLPPDMDESWIRLLLGFPGSLLTAAAFLSESSALTSVKSVAAKTNLTITAAAFGVYAFLSGLIAHESRLPALSWLNYENVHTFTSFPVQFWRMLIGIVIAFFVIRTLLLFDLEMRNRLEVAEREQALFMDRQRIARDLHDGVVQTIYAAGLQLEVASQSVRKDVGEASVTIRHVVNQLNDVIADIRKYIFKLGPARTGEADFDQYMMNIVDDLTAGSDLKARLRMEGDRVELTPGQRQNIAFVTRECLSNVAQHAKATQVELRMMFNPDSLFFVVEDDGIGIETSASTSKNLDGHRGLKSIAERTKAMNGELVISQRSEQGGTMIGIRIPYNNHNSQES